MIDNLEEKIIIFLENNLGYKLPKNGVIAGQSVAEAFFRVLNKDIKTKIKDVDLFANDYKGLNDFYNKEDKINKYKIINNNQIKLTNKNLSYGMINTVIDSRFTILNVMEKNKLNIIITEKIENDEAYLESVIESFDINAVQIGIDLKTKKMYKTKYFDEFVKNKILKIVNFSTIAPSLCRIIEKHKNFENINIDLEKEIKLSIYKILFYNKKEYINKKGLCMSEERFENFSIETKNIIKKYFEIEIILIDKNKTFKIVKFKPKENLVIKKNIQKIQNIKNYFISNNIDFNYLNRNFLENLEIKDFDKKIIKLIKNSNILKIYSFKKDIYKENLSDLETVSKHLAFTIKMSDNFTINEISKYIKKLEKNNSLYIINMFNAGYLKDPIFISKDLDKLLLEIKNKELSEEKPKEFPVNLIKNDLYDIIQIKTKSDFYKLLQSSRNKFLYDYNDLLSNKIILLKLTSKISKKNILIEMELNYEKIFLIDDKFNNEYKEEYNFIDQELNLEKYFIKVKNISTLDMIEKVNLEINKKELIEQVQLIIKDYF